MRACCRTGQILEPQNPKILFVRLVPMASNQTFEQHLKYRAAPVAKHGLCFRRRVEMNGQEQGVGVGQPVHPVCNLFLVIHCGQIRISYLTAHIFCTGVCLRGLCVENSHGKHKSRRMDEDLNGFCVGRGRHDAVLFNPCIKVGALVFNAPSKSDKRDA